MKLIDKEKVIEYILKRKSEIYDEYGGIVTTQRGLVEYKMLQEMQGFLNTLETKEVDLEKEFYDFLDTLIGKDNGHLSEDELFRIAEYFYELGLKSKGE